MATKYRVGNENKNFIEALADIAFFAWIILTFFLERNIVGRLALAAFAGSVVLYMIIKGTISGNVKSKLTIANLYFLSYVLFLVYNDWNTNYGPHVLNRGVADAMFGTLCLNFIFIYCVYKYCVLKDKMEEILNLYVIANMIIMAMIIVVSGKGILSGRLGGAMDVNANIVALAMINCLIITMHKNTKEKKAINMLIMCICVVSILLTGSRKGLIGMAIGLVLYQCMDKGFKKYKNLFIVAVIMVVAYYLIMNVEPLYNIAGERVEALLSYFKGESYKEASLDTRDAYAQLGWKYVGKNLWMGYGLNNFSVLKGAYGVYSHNNYLELLFGCGIVGTAFYYLGYLYVVLGHLKLYLKHKIIDSKPYIILMIIQIFLEYAYVSYFERKSILFVVLSLAALQLLKSKIQSEVKENEQIDEAIEESV